MATEQDKRTRITISVPEELLEKVDKAAMKEYTNRSQWIIYAMLEKVRKLDRGSDVEQTIHNQKELEDASIKELK